MQTQLVDPPLAGSEIELMLGFLRYQQQVFLRKLERESGDLLADQELSKSLAPTTMTLKGMAAHLWFVEDYWRDWIAQGLDLPTPWDAADWETDPDFDWHIDLPSKELINALCASIAKTHSLLESADWDELSKRADKRGQHFSLRWIAFHLVEEWARHLGHADLLRENIDGTVGD